MILKFIKKISQRIFLLNIVFILCLFILNSCLHNLNSTVKKTDSNSITADIIMTDDYERIYTDEYVIYNNVWGNKNAKKYEQLVFQENKDELNPFGWTWNWPDNGNGYVKAYPEIYFGQSPWTENSTTDKIPIKIEDIKDITLTYDIESNAKGIYNLAVEFWLTSEKNATESNITTEVMIWLDENNWPWSYTLIRQVEIDDEEYGFYKGSVHHAGWDYIVFRKINPEYKGDTKIHEFTKYLVENNYINKNEYIACIDIGNEVINGSGFTKFLDYSISVE